MADRLAGTPASEKGSETNSLDAGSKLQAANSLPTRPSPRCPHCHQTLHLPVGGMHEAVCPECGSSFRLEREDSTTTIDYRRGLGELELLESLGRGATGTVWKAWDTKLHRLVAVKIPHDSLLVSPDYAERLLREARTAARLEHPGIVRLHEARTIDGVPVLITGFIDGITLSELLKLRPLPFRGTAEIVAAVADALDYAHSMGCVHRDIKPGNIMMARGECVTQGESQKQQPQRAPAAATVFDRRTGGGEAAPFRPVIVDFGLALRPELENVLTIEGQLLGTVAYMSPEQARGQAHRADARTDVYCLGVVLYQMLTGELPFRGSRAMILDQVLREDPRRPRQINDKIGRDLETICLKALHKEPHKRYPTAGAMARDLRCYLENKPIAARPTGRVERLLRWCKRSPKLASASGLAAVSMILALVMLGLWNFQKSAALYASQRNEAVLALDRAIDHLNKDEGNLGLLWLGRALKLAPPEAEDLQFVIRANLGAWLARAASPQAVVTHGDEVVTAVALSQNGRTAATGCYRKAFLWDVQTGQLRGPPLTHEGHVWCISFSPEGRLLVTASGDQQKGGGEVKFWDAETGAERGSLPRFAGEVREIHFTQDGRRLLTVADSAAQVWDMATRRPLAKLTHTGTVLAGAFSPDGKWVVTCGVEDREVRLWEVATGSMKRRWHYPAGGGAKVAAFSPDSQAFVTGHVDGKVRIRRIDTPDSHAVTSKHQAGVRSVSFSPDGTRVLTASDDWTARIWDASTGKPLTPPMMHQGYLQAAAFSGDGRYIATGGSDKTARVWEPASGRAICLPLQHQGAVQAVAVSRDGSLVLTGSYDFTARIWALPHDPPWRGRLDSREEIRMAAFYADGKQLLKVSQQRGHGTHAQLFDIQTGAPAGGNLAVGRGTLVACAVSKDAQLLAAAGDPGAVQIWDIRSSHPAGRVGPLASPIRAVSFHGNGRWLLTGSANGEVQCWDIRSGQRLGEPLSHKSEVDTLAVSLDDTRVLVGCWDRSAHLWELGSRHELKVFLHQDPVSAVAFSPDGRLLATSAGKTVRIWNASGEFEQRFALAHPAAAAQVAFNHAGQLLVTGCADGAARLWDVTTGKQIGPPLFQDLFHFPNADLWSAAPTTAVAFSPDDTQVLAAGADQNVRIWQVPEPVSDSADDVVRRIEVLTVMRLDAAGAPVDLNLPYWQESRARVLGLH